MDQVERWFTPDSGRSWQSQQLTSHDDGFSIRPVTPRGSDLSRVLYSFGDERTRGYRDYTTRIHALDF